MDPLMTLPAPVAHALTHYLGVLRQGERGLHDLHEQARAVRVRDTICEIRATRTTAPVAHPLMVSLYPSIAPKQSAHARLSHEAHVAQDSHAVKATYATLGPAIAQAQQALHTQIEGHRADHQRGLVILTQLQLRDNTPRLSWTWYLYQLPEDTVQQALTWKLAHDGYAPHTAAACLAPLLRLRPCSGGEPWTLQGPTDHRGTARAEHFRAADRTQAFVLGAWLADPFLLAQPKQVAIYQHYSPLQQAHDLAAFLHPTG